MLRGAAVWTCSVVVGVGLVGSALAQPVPRFRPGEPYRSVRQALLRVGFTPYRSPDSEGCRNSNGVEMVPRSACFPEVDACAGTGTGNCLFVWERNGAVYRVVTLDEPPLFKSMSALEAPRGRRSEVSAGTASGSTVTVAPATRLIDENADASKVRRMATTALYRPNSMMSAVGNLTFPSNSPMARAVARACEPNGLCRLIAEVTVEGRAETMTKVLHVERPPRFRAPEILIGYIYRNEQSDRVSLHEAAWREVFSPPTAALLSAVYVKHMSGDLDGPFIPQPWWSPETQPKDVRVTYMATGPQSVTAAVTHGNRNDFGETTSRLRYKLVETPQGWRIDDVEFLVGKKWNGFVADLRAQAR